MMPKLICLVLTRNRASLLCRCLDALQQSDYENQAVLVVDNGSTDNTQAILAERQDNVEYIRLDQNTGYAAGNNVGIRAALADSAEFILLLNDDVYVHTDTVRTLVKVAQRMHNSAAVTCKVRLASHPERLWAAGEFLPMLPIESEEHNVERLVRYGVGACLLLRAATVAEVGGLDEVYFATYEEVDWCARVRRNGYDIVYTPETAVLHDTCQSLTSHSSPLRAYLMTRNRALLAWRESTITTHRHRLNLARITTSLEIQQMQKQKILSIPLIWAVIQGAFDFWRGRFGMPPMRLLKEYEHG